MSLSNLMEFEKEPIICLYCNNKIYFKYYPLIEKQKLEGFCGDNRGYYPLCNCIKNKELITIINKEKIE